MALASTGARLPIFKCTAWLKCTTGTGNAGGRWGTADVSWHWLQICFDGSRSSCALVLVTAAGWHVPQLMPMPRWSLCEKGAAPQAAPHANRIATLYFTYYFL